MDEVQGDIDLKIDQYYHNVGNGLWVITLVKAACVRAFQNERVWYLGVVSGKV